MADSTSIRAARYALVLLTLINLVNYLDRNIVPAVEEWFKPDLGLTDTRIGFVASSFTIVYMLFSPFFGALGDRSSRVRLIALGVVVWSLATAGAGLAVGFLSLLIARSLVGVGEAAYGTLGPTLLSDYFPKSQRGRVFSVFYSAIPIGTALGYIAGGWMGTHHGWRSAFFVAGIPGLVLGALLYFLPDPPHGRQDEDDSGLGGDSGLEGDAAGAGGHALGATTSGWKSYPALLHNRTYLLVVLGYSAYTFALGGLQIWGPAFLARERGMTPGKAAMVFGVLLAGAGFLGTFTGGWIGDRMLRRNRQAYLWVSGITTLLAVPLGFVALLAPSPAVFLPALFLAAVFAFMSTGPINTAIVNVVPPPMRAAAMAGSILAIHVLGDAASPTIIGMLSERSSLGMAVLIVPVALAVGAAIWVYAAWSGERRAAG